MQAAFQRQLNRLAPDIKIVWNTEIERWQIVQIRAKIGKILTLEMNSANMGKAKPWVLAIIQTEVGNYRHPDDSDLLKIITAVSSQHHLQDVGANNYADEMDAVSAAGELARKRKRNELWQDVDKDIQSALTMKRKTIR